MAGFDIFIREKTITLTTSDGTTLLNLLTASFPVSVLRNMGFHSRYTYIIGMIGLPKNKVFLVEYTDEWANAYERESERIIKLIGQYVASIHHIGSTAVPGLKAKPIIDIAVELFSFEDGFLCITPLNRIGYKHRIIPELPERHYFSKGDPRTHQIHMYKPGSKYLMEQLSFKDKLRSDPDLIKKYQAIKESLSEKFSNDKLSYTDAKTKFIHSVINAK